MGFVEECEGIAINQRKKNIIIIGCHQWVAQCEQSSDHGWKMMESCST